jgi:hypothetical protein
MIYVNEKCFRTHTRIYQEETKKKKKTFNQNLHHVVIEIENALN